MEMLKPYRYQAQYFETDQMGIIHHSNFIRWMESARIEFMSQMGLEYDRMEAEGIVSPVLAVSCEYKSMVHFRDVVEVWAWIKEYNGVKLTVGYRIVDQETGKLRSMGESRHCFLTKEGRPVSLSRSFPEWDRLFQEAARLVPDGVVTKEKGS